MYAHNCTHKCYLNFNWCKSHYHKKVIMQHVCNQDLVSKIKSLYMPLPCYFDMTFVSHVMLWFSLSVTAVSSCITMSMSPKI